jgi:hypothetical protein
LNQSIYYIEKSSQTFADNLSAFGLAYVLEAVARGQAQIRLEDQGMAFAVVCEPSIQPAWIEEATFVSGAPFLVTVDNKTQKKVVKGADLPVAELPISADVVVDYEEEKHNNSEFHTWRNSLSKEERKQFYNGDLRPPVSPHPDWDLFRAVNPAALQAYNKLIGEWWRAGEAFPHLLEILLQMTSKLPNDIEGAERAWLALCEEKGWPKLKEVTASQLFNPSQGKGSFAAKAVWSSPGNLKGFWLLEWLKIVGLRHGGFTKQIRGSKDRKTYALAPVRLSWDVHRAVMKNFRTEMAGSATAIQMDILASLRYTRTLLKHYQEARVEDLAAELFGHPATDLVGGMQMAFYKNLGNAIATMNIACINLPAWVWPKQPKDLAQLGEALWEHEVIVRSLDEGRSDQYGLLDTYRDFLSSNEMKPFFKFTNAYGNFIMHQMERRQFVRPFTTSTLEVLFMNANDTQKRFSLITQSPGFQAIAYAIRHSTVVPQGRKSKGNRPVVEIRYGLGQQLTRKAAYANDFLAEIANFIFLYNAENAQLRENKRELFRKNITTQDLDELTKLVDDYGPEVVCNLLVAYGYAREPFEREKDVDNGVPEPEPGEDATSDETESAEE